MRVTIRIVGEQGRPGDPERDLATWLARHPALAGRIHPLAQRSPVGGLGETVAALIADLSTAGLGVLGGALIAWLRNRRSSTRVVVHRPDGSKWELQAGRIRALGPAELTALIDQLARVSAGPPAPDAGAERTVTAQGNGVAPEHGAVQGDGAAVEPEAP